MRLFLRCSRGLQEAVLADGLVREFANDLALLHDQDPIGEGQDRFRLPRHADNTKTLRATAAPHSPKLSPFFLIRVPSARGRTVSGPGDTTITASPCSRRPRTILTTSSL